MAIRHMCGSQHFYDCDQGSGKAPRHKCRRCGAPLREEQGVWGVFFWNSANRYPRADAHKLFNDQKAAEKRAYTLNLVVRWIPEPQ